MSPKASVGWKCSEAYVKEMFLPNFEVSEFVDDIRGAILILRTAWEFLDVLESEAGLVKGSPFL